MTVPSTNYSDIRFGTHSNAERYCWVAYFLFGLLSTVIGDILILYATFQRSAFKVNKSIVIIIQHIAVCDLGFALFSALPSAISLIANRWILGDGLCYVRLYAAHYVYPAGMSLIMLLTTTKFLIMKFPFRSARWTPKRVHLVCAVTWVFSLSVNILKLAVDKDDVAFDYRFYTCEYGYRDSRWKTIGTVSYLIILFGPNLVIVATTVPTLSYIARARKAARKVRGSVPWQGALAVALTAMVYCISTLPYTLYQVIIFMDEDHPARFHADPLFRASYFVLVINVIANFYIYILTIRSFRRFIFKKFFGVQVPLSLQSIGRASFATGNVQTAYLA